MWAGGAAIIVLRVHTGDHRCLPLRLVHVQAAVAVSSYTCRREPVSLDSGCACKVSCDHLWCDRSREFSRRDKLAIAPLASPRSP